MQNNLNRCTVVFNYFSKIRSFSILIFQNVFGLKKQTALPALASLLGAAQPARRPLHPGRPASAPRPSWLHSPARRLRPAARLSRLLLTPPCERRCFHTPAGMNHSPLRTRFKSRGLTLKVEGALSALCLYVTAPGPATRLPRPRGQHRRPHPLRMRADPSQCAPFTDQTPPLTIRKDPSSALEAPGFIFNEGWSF